MWAGNHIGHHGNIGHHVFFTSHVVLSGHCTVGDNCWFGVNSTIKDFNMEMESVFDDLKFNEKKKQAMLLKLRKEKSPKVAEEEKRKKNWEEKLLELYSRDNDESENDKILEETNIEDKK